MPDSATIAIAREDDFTFGVLHSSIHAVWAIWQGTSLGKGNAPRYTPTTSLATFPFPHPTDPQQAEIETWAKYLDDVRQGLLGADSGGTTTGIDNVMDKLRESRTATQSVRC